MPRKRADPHVVALLEGLLDDARKGDLIDLFVLGHYHPGGPDAYAECFYTDDLDEMLLELRSAVIRAQCDRNRELNQVEH